MSMVSYKLLSLPQQFLLSVLNTDFRNILSIVNNQYSKNLLHNSFWKPYSRENKIYFCKVEVSPDYLHGLFRALDICDFKTVWTSKLSFIIWK
jgi:hypothetical protein